LCPDPKDPHCTDLPLVDELSNRKGLQYSAAIASGGTFGKVMARIINFFAGDDAAPAPVSTGTPKPSPNFEAPTNAAQPVPSDFLQATPFVWANRPSSTQTAIGGSTMSGASQSIPQGANRLQM
jgi:hypothetical protein